MRSRIQYQTPNTRLVWDDMATWLAHWMRLQRRRDSKANYAAAQAHVDMLAGVVREFLLPFWEPDTLKRLRDRFKRTHASYGGQPVRGYREGHPSTLIIMEINNRIRLVERAVDHASMGQGHNSKQFPITGHMKGLQMTKEHKVLKASHVEVQKINLIAAEVGKYVSPEDAYELATRLVLEPGLFEKLDGIRNAA